MQQVVSLFPDFDEKYMRQLKTRVYFGLGDNGQIKIGLTSRPIGRRGGEMHFTELCSVIGDRATEDYYHTKYRRCRIGRTEWFHLDDGLLLDLIIMCVQQGETQSVETLRGLILGRLELAAAA